MHHRRLSRTFSKQNFRSYFLILEFDVNITLVVLSEGLGKFDIGNKS